MFNDEESFALNKMHEFSAVDGFAELTENLADMIKHVANEPSVGLFYVQQHTRNAVPNLINLKNNVEEKSRKMSLHTEDSEDSITMLRSMKQYGSPICDNMLKDIQKSLAIMSTKQPKKGLINSPSSSFQSGYFSTVIKSAKEKASNIKWPQLDNSTMVTSRVSGGEVREEELENDGSLGTLELQIFENFDEFRAEREAKLEEWLGEVRDHDGHAGESDSRA